MNGGTLIAVGGIGAAVYLYMRSQQRQAEELAAATSAPGPGLTQKLGNSFKVIGKLGPTAIKSAFSGVAHDVSNKGATITKPIAGAATGLVGTIKGIF